VSRRRRSNQRGGRDDSPQSLTPWLPRPEPSPLTFYAPRSTSASRGFSFSDSDLLEFEDRRTWYPGAHIPTGYAPPRTFFGSPARVVLGGPRSGFLGPSRPLRGAYPSFRVGFEHPRSTLVCVRRQQRREVLHAKRVAGRSGLRPPRRSIFSSVSCRR